MYNKEYLNTVLKNKEAVFVPGREKAKLIIKEHFKNGEKIIIYGAGRIGEEICEILKSAGCEPVAFLDRNAEDIKWKKGIEVYTPIDKIGGGQYKVLISLFLSKQAGQALIDDLNMLGYEDVIFDKNLISCFCAWGLRQEVEERLYNSKEDILRVFSMLQDDISREVFIRNLEAHTKWDYSDVIQQTDMEQYFDVRVPFLKGYSNFVDCGAYIGDSFIEMIKRHKCDSYIAFEPDLDNFKKLTQTIEEYGQDTEEVLLYPCAVSDKNGYLFFHSDGSTGGCLCTEEDSSEMISTVNLDSVLKKKQVGMIKMDIEGAEIDALKGAHRIITEQKPDLAICVYHTISDLWKIPLLIKEMSEDYVFYLRCHAPWSVETVLYATTKDKM